MNEHAGYRELARLARGRKSADSSFLLRITTIRRRYFKTKQRLLLLPLLMRMKEYDRGTETEKKGTGGRDTLRNRKSPVERKWREEKKRNNPVLLYKWRKVPGSQESLYCAHAFSLDANGGGEESPFRGKVIIDSSRVPRTAPYNILKTFDLSDEIAFLSSAMPRENENGNAPPRNNSRTSDRVYTPICDSV